MFPILAPESPALSFSSGVAWSLLLPLTQALALCTLCFSSTLFSESIPRSKHPEGYSGCQQRVDMFVPFLTPIWGWLLSLQGRKEKIDQMLFGQETAVVKKNE